MSKINIIPYIIIVVLVVLLWFRGCEKEGPEVITVTIPEKSGTFEPQLPVYLPGIPRAVYITKWRDREVETENPVNEELAEAYQTALDSLDRFRLYLDAIQIRQFSNTFEDDYVKIVTQGEVQGQLNWIKPDYTIKSRNVTIDTEKPPVRLLGGFDLGSDTNLSGLRYKASLGLQNRSGDIFTGSYGDGGYIWVGYYRSLVRF